MADKSNTTSVNTFSTTVTAPTRSGFTAEGGAQWRSLRLTNIGSNRIHVNLSTGTAVADADETVVVLPNVAQPVLIRYRSSFTAIAETGATKLQVVGSVEDAWL